VPSRVIDEVAVFAAAPSFAKLNNFAVGVAPRGVTIDKAGNVFVANQQSNDVVMYDSSGNETAHFKVGRCPENMAVDSKGDLWVTNACSSTVTEIKGAGAAALRTVGVVE
jgi:DNA-binding beta-propeller fold protein YncE